ncbi:hypothetical protein cypCar_00050345, partial [Cyprinus carpio]
CVCVCVQVTDVESEPQPVIRQRRRRHVWRVSGGLMSSSQESVALRRALLNPVTRLQFQKFLSVRDDLLENDLLFWLEVQRYKVRRERDAPHTHLEKELHLS